MTHMQYKNMIECVYYITEMLEESSEHVDDMFDDDELRTMKNQLVHTSNFIKTIKANHDNVK